ncbi:MAG: hypothetical protein HZC25_11795 [Rhodospirillales bacterium]|nr:hypothetical protein [Rhodospirillales bacterium]
MSTLLAKSDILRGLRKLGRRAQAAGLLIDIAIYGGSALCLAYNMRKATKDVDAAITGDRAFLRQAAASVAEEEGWPRDWLYEGVKGFLSAHEKLETLPIDGIEGVRIYVPTAQYLFAMKCMAMRLDGIEGSHDIADIENLAPLAGIETARQALDLIADFYPQERIPAKVRFGVEEIMERLAQRKAGSP